MNILKKPDRSLFWNGIIFASVAIALVALNIMGIVLLRDTPATNLGIFMVDAPKDLVGATDYGNINTNPLFFSFIEVAALPMWASSLMSVVAILALTSLLLFTTRKTNIVFIAIVSAALLSNLTSMFHKGIAERTITVSWLFDLQMNMLDFVMLLSIPVFIIYWIVVLVYEINDAKTSGAYKIKKEKKERNQISKIENLTPIKLETKPEEIKIASSEARPSRRQSVVVSTSATPMQKIEKTQMINVAETKVEPAKVEVKPVVTPTVVKPVVQPTPTPVVFKQTPTPTPVAKPVVAPATSIKKVAKTPEEIEEEEMRKSLEALKGSF